MDTFSTLSIDVILSIYICMLCGIACNKLSNVAANFLKKIGVKSQYTHKSRGIFARAKLSLLSPFNTVNLCSRSRGKLSLRSYKAGVKSQR
jgi:hypothetical protein